MFFAAPNGETLEDYLRVRIDAFLLHRKSQDMSRAMLDFYRRKLRNRLPRRTSASRSMSPTCMHVLGLSAIRVRIGEGSPSRQWCMIIAALL